MSPYHRIAILHHRGSNGGCIILIRTDGYILRRTCLAIDVGGNIIQREGLQQITVKVVGRLKHCITEEADLLVDAASGTGSLHEGGKIAIVTRRSTEECRASSVDYIVLERNLVEVFIIIEVYGIAAAFILYNVVDHVDVLAKRFVKQPQRHTGVVAMQADGVVGDIHIADGIVREFHATIACIERRNVDDVVGNDDRSLGSACHLTQIHTCGVFRRCEVEGVARNLT